MSGSQRNPLHSQCQWVGALLIRLLTFAVFWTATVSADTATMRSVRSWEAKQAQAESLLLAEPLAAAIHGADPVAFAMLVDTVAKRLDKPKQQALLARELHELVSDVVRQKLLMVSDEDVIWYFDSELDLMQDAERLDPVRCGHAVVTNRDIAIAFADKLTPQKVRGRNLKLADVIGATKGKSTRAFRSLDAESALIDVMTTLRMSHGDAVDMFGEYTTDKRELISQCHMAVDMFQTIKLMNAPKKANLYRMFLQPST